ncbi:MAG TPA: DUF4389 domain-containing protein [Acidimicrobiia bacterium]
MQPAADGYPIGLDIDYPDRNLNRLTTFFRIFVAIPIIVVLAAVNGGGLFAGTARGGFIAAGGLLFLGPLLMILVREKYPRWWFDWNLALLRFHNRVGAFLLLLRDEYPSTDEHQSVHLDIAYPDAPTQLNRWLPIVKWLLAIPHYIALIGLDLSGLVVVIVAWFSILFTGRYPRWAFDFVVGVMRWNDRVLGYAFLLVTDQYPPFSLDN